MKNNVRIKMEKLNRLADFVDALNSDIEQCIKENNRYKEMSDEERPCWADSSIITNENRIEAYTALMRELEKLC